MRPKSPRSNWSAASTTRTPAPPTARPRRTAQGPPWPRSGRRQEAAGRRRRRGRGQAEARPQEPPRRTRVRPALEPEPVVSRPSATIRGPRHTTRPFVVLGSMPGTGRRPASDRIRSLPGGRHVCPCDGLPQPGSRSARASARRRAPACGRRPPSSFRPCRSGTTRSVALAMVLFVVETLLGVGAARGARRSSPGGRLRTARRRGRGSRKAAAAAAADGAAVQPRAWRPAARLRGHRRAARPARCRCRRLPGARADGWRSFCSVAPCWTRCWRRCARSTWLESAAAWQGSRTSVLVIGFLVGTPFMLWCGNSQAYFWVWFGAAAVRRRQRAAAVRTGTAAPALPRPRARGVQLMRDAHRRRPRDGTRVGAGRTACGPGGVLLPDAGDCPGPERRRWRCCCS